MSNCSPNSIVCLVAEGGPTHVGGQGGFSYSARVKWTSSWCSRRRISLEIKWKQDGPEVLMQHNKMETQTGKQGFKLITWLLEHVNAACPHTNHTVRLPPTEITHLYFYSFFLPGNHWPAQCVDQNKTNTTRISGVRGRAVDWWSRSGFLLPCSVLSPIKTWSNS